MCTRLTFFVFTMDSVHDSDFKQVFRPPYTFSQSTGPNESTSRSRAPCPRLDEGMQEQDWCSDRLREHLVGVVFSLPNVNFHQCHPYRSKGPCSWTNFFFLFSMRVLDLRYIYSTFPINFFLLSFPKFLILCRSPILS